MLVWSCLAAIITYTWSALYLNFLNHYESKYQPLCKRLCKAKWMCVTILFPKFIFAKAFCELKEAVDDTFEIIKNKDKLGFEVEFRTSCEFLFRLFYLFNKKNQNDLKPYLSLNNQRKSKL